MLVSQTSAAGPGRPERRANGRGGPVDGPVGGLATDRAAQCLLAAAQERGLTIAVAESLTGGQVCEALVSIPGASAVVLGGVVAYATAVKARVLGVEEGLLAAVGPVDARVARQMASGVVSLMGADLGLATTGVAGPGPAEGHPAGTVHIAVASPWGTVSRELHLDGDRADVRAATTASVVALAVGLLDASRGS